MGMDDQDEVSLIVAGNRHDGWENVSIHQGIEEVAPTFSLDYSQRWSHDGTPVPIRRGDVVEVRIGQTLVLTGKVDEAFEEYDASSHRVSCSGRSRTGQVVDCSAIYKTGQIARKNLLQIAEVLCAPFGVSVSLSAPDLDIGGRVSLSQFNLQDGESPFEAINEIARKEGVLLLSNPEGNLVLSRASSTPVPGVRLSGENIKHGSLRESERDRYSLYIFKSQAPGSDTLSGVQAAQLKHSITDDDVKSYRPLIVTEHQATLERLRQRALWERNTRAGRAAVFGYDVVGWRNAAGLWSVNSLVHVSDEVFGFDGELLVTSVDFQRSLDQGRVTRLELMARETFDVLKPPRPPKRKKTDPLL
jgi:prophage tail gpP-like protein